VKKKRMRRRKLRRPWQRGDRELESLGLRLRMLELWLELDLELELESEIV
jgi:hypothetical protein